MAAVQHCRRTARAECLRRAAAYRWGNLLVNVALALICLLWTIPTLGLLISSFRPREDIISYGLVDGVPAPGLGHEPARSQLPTDTPLDQPVNTSNGRDA